MLPSAAEEFRQQIKEGLAGDVSASLRARVALRQLFGGQIKMLPEQDGSLYAEYQQQRIALLQGVGTNGGPCRDRTYDQLIKSPTVLSSPPIVPNWECRGTRYEIAVMNFDADALPL